MDERTSGLIAVGASIGAHCQPCLTYHVGRARELGIDEEEIAEALAVGFMVEKGATMAMKKHVRVALSQEGTQDGACCTAGDSECCA